MTIRFVAMPTDRVRALQAGAADANGLSPERHISDGDGVPCRHCLAPVAAGDPFLILAHRPFPAPQPYAEIGPVFLHADPCARYATETALPQMFLTWPGLLVRGYDAGDRIVYGTGQITATADLATVAADLLTRPEVAYLHLRSAANNCYQCRVERGE
ncbi:MAG: DUF1203 domain-containing protein [Inquilinaceae bacterium]